MALWKLTDSQLSIPKYLDRGQVVAVRVTAGGTGYGAAPAVTFSAPASGVAATGTAVLTGGVVTSVTITNPGYGYKASDNIAITFASGVAAASAVVHGIAYLGSTIYFVDRTESQIKANKDRGMTSPGWWIYKTYTDAQGKTRHKSELLIAADATAAAAGDQSDDAILVDTQVILSALADKSATAGQTATFGPIVSSTIPTGEVVTYQWQKSNDAGTNWAAISGATSASYVTAALTVVDDNNDLYRVVGTSRGVSTTSNTAKLTVTV